MDQLNKKRSANWTTEEKEILRQLVAQSCDILENKSTRTNINSQKVREWKNVATKISELTGKTRSDVEVKLAWKRMKLTAKANLSMYRQEQIRTGGGEKPKSPSQEDQQIMAIAPYDFVIDINDYDSDAIQTAVEVTPADPVPVPSSEYVTVIENPVHITEANATEYEVPDRTSRNRTKKGHSNKKEHLQEKILESNKLFKKRQMEMMEIEHDYNVKIAKLKIRKLELEIGLLENKNKN